MVQGRRHQRSISVRMARVGVTEKVASVQRSEGDVGKAILGKGTVEGDLCVQPRVGGQETGHAELVGTDEGSSPRALESHWRA